MERRGFSARDVLKGTGLTTRELQSRYSQASPAQYRQLMQNMLALTGNAKLGLEIGQEYKISDMGVLGYAMLSSKTMRQARMVMSRYNKLVGQVLGSPTTSRTSAGGSPHRKPSRLEISTPLRSRNCSLPR